MKFRPGNLYRFKINRDVGFEVLKAFYVKERDRWNLKVCWWNIGACHEPWPMQITQRLVIGAIEAQDVVKIPHTFRVPNCEFDPIYFLRSEV